MPMARSTVSVRAAAESRFRRTRGMYDSGCTFALLGKGAQSVGPQSWILGLSVPRARYGRASPAMKVGAVIRLVEDRGADDAGSGRCPSFSEILATARHMEAAGFDSMWVFDHLLYRPPAQATIGVWEGWTMLSALAAATERIELGALVTCSQFRNPALLAKMAVTVDEISGGRLIFGIGAGWNEPEFRAFGIPLDHRVGRFEEALQIIVPLLREGHVDFSGRFYSARDCELNPRGPRPNGPPVLIGGWRARLLRLAARYADVWNAGYYSRVETFAEQRAAFETARAEVGGQSVEISATLKVAWEDLGQPPGFFGSDYVTGPADAIAEILSEYAESGVAHVMCQYHPTTEVALERLSEALAAYRSLENV